MNAQRRFPDRLASAVRRARTAWATMPIVTLTLALAAVAIQLIPGWAAAWQYERAAIAAGQWWRMLTGHLTHWNMDHLLWDVVMFVVLGVLVERRGHWRLAGISLLSALGISLTAWLAQPDLPSYRGLSGIDTALFVYLACRLLEDAWHDRHWAALVLPTAFLAGFALKLGYEVVTGRTLFVAADAGFVVVALAHVVGASVGAVLGLMSAGTRWRSVRASRLAPMI